MLRRGFGQGSSAGGEGQAAHAVESELDWDKSGWGESGWGESG